MDVLQVVRQLRDLAADPQNRTTIVRDQGCLPGLVVFLDNRNPEVVATALEALHYLAEVPTNRPFMKNEVGLVISLRNITRKSDYEPQILRLAEGVLNFLIPPAASSSRPLSQARGATGKSNVFLGASNKKARNVVLHIAGMTDQTTRSIVEEHLLSVKGVISFTMDISRQRCSIRLKSDLKPEVICRTINDTGILTAQQIVKNELGEEVYLSFGPTSEGSHTPLEEKENKQPGALPSYLPEEEGEMQLDDTKALEKSGMVDGGSGWFSSVTGLLGKAFYW